MLYKAIFLCLVAAAVCQNGQNNGDLESIIGQIFGTPPPTATPPAVENKSPGPSTLVPGVVTSKPDDLDAIIEEIFGPATPTPVANPTESVHLKPGDSGNTKPVDPGNTNPLNPVQSTNGNSMDTVDPGYPDEELGSLDLVYDGQTMNTPQDLTCTTPEGQAGECVPYYLCNVNNNTVNTDGVGVIDIRVRDGPCLSYIDTCCLVPDKTETPVTPKPEPKREGCGWRNPKGVDIRTTGEKDGETKFAEFPWMCAILKIEPVNDNEPDGQKLNVYVGGGSLIHPSVVLTAAHYVAASPQLRVRAGEWDTQSVKEPHPYQDREVSTIQIHEDFNKGNLFYDIAVLFASQPFDLAPNVGVACLPPPRERVPGGTRCFATGWGKDRFGKEGRYQVILKKIDVPVVDRAACQTALRKTRLGRFFELHTSFMCAGGEPGKDTCKGDGGSPLSCPIETEDNRYMQSGIVAWGIGCGEDGTPGVYVDVSNLRSWVDDKVAGKGYDPKTYSF